MSSYLKMLQTVNNHHNDEILKFCSKLFKHFNLNHFWHYRLTNEGFISFIGSHADWTEFFASEKFFLIYPNLRHPKYLQQRVYLHKDAQDPSLKQIYDVSDCKYEIRQSVVFVNKIPEGVEEFGFSSSSPSEVQTSTFFTELSLFRFFIRKFKEENQRLLSKLQDLQINIGELIGASFYENCGTIPKNSSKQNFLKSMGVALEAPLSSREIDVVKLLLQGFPASQMASRLFLSKRTIEHHMERIKGKLRCDSKAELIQKARELEGLGCLLEG